MIASEYTQVWTDAFYSHLARGNIKEMMWARGRLAPGMAEQAEIRSRRRDVKTGAPNA